MRHEVWRIADADRVVTAFAEVPCAYIADGHHRTASAAAWVRRTNIAGLADFAVALGTGFLSAPGAIQFLALDRPNELIGLYPLVLIPVFAVPVFIGVHILSIRLHLAHRAEAGGGDPVLA